MDDLLRRFPPKGPSAGLRGRVLDAVSQAQAEPRRKSVFVRAYAAALAAVFIGALIYGAWSGNAHEERMAALTERPPDAVLVRREADRLAALLNGDKQLAASMRPSLELMAAASLSRPVRPLDWVALSASMM